MVNTPTNFLNAKRRRIYQGERGGFFVRDADGKMHRGIKAAYRKVGANGTESKLGPKNRESVPAKLRRAVRKNKGVARKPKAVNVVENVIENVVNAVTNVVAPKKPRRVRKNKGVKRGPRKPAYEALPNKTELKNMLKNMRIRNRNNVMIVPTGPIPKLAPPPGNVRRSRNVPNLINLRNNNFGPFQGPIPKLAPPPGNVRRSRNVPNLINLRNNNFGPFQSA